MYGIGFIAKLAVSLPLAIEPENLRRTTSVVLWTPVVEPLLFFPQLPVFPAPAVSALSVNYVLELCS